MRDKSQSVGAIMHTPFLCIPRGEPEVFSDEQWVHFRATEETLVSHREEAPVRLALFSSVSPVSPI